MSPPPPSVYPTQLDPLRKLVDDLLQKASAPQIDGDLMSLIVPDTNRTEGAAAAAEAFKLVEGERFEVVLALAPSREGSFGRIAVARADEYVTPLGAVTVHDGLRNELCDEDDDIFLDDRGHYHAEGVAVQLPFLQRALSGPFEVVPVVMGDESPAFCRELGAALGEVMYGRRALLVASADVVSAEADALGRFATALEAMDIPELMHLLGSERLKVEGSGPIIVAVLAAQQRGANRARVLHATAPEGERRGALAAALWRS